MKSQAEKRKEQRTIKKIYDLIKDKKAVFLTMTFNDETLKNTNQETRKRYIKEYLKSESALYIANIDYGTKHEREHYHAIVKATLLIYVERAYQNIKDLIDLKAYKYGQIKAEKIGNKYGFKNDKDIKKTAKYLYEHSIKETTKNNKLIVSRKEPTIQQEYERLNRLKKSLDKSEIIGSIKII